MKREEQQHNNGIGFFLAFCGGALAGAAVAALLTPVTGRDARTRIKELASNAKDGAARIPHALSEGTQAVRATISGRNATQ